MTGPEIKINRIVGPEDEPECIVSPIYDDQIVDQVMSATKVAADYLYINEEVEELTGPALKNEKITYKDQEMNYYHFIEMLIAKSYKLNATIKKEEEAIKLKVLDPVILNSIMKEVENPDRYFQNIKDRIYIFMVVLNSKTNYYEKLKKKCWQEKDEFSKMIIVENNFKMIINKFEADHGLDLKKVLMGVLGVPWHEDKCKVLKRIKP